MPFQDSTNLNNISEYIVDANGGTPYLTVQAALDAANTAGLPTAIYLRAGTYTENLTLYDNIDLWGAIGVADTETCKIVGVHTPSATGALTIRNIFLESLTDVFNSAVAGTTELILIDCAIDVTNGYTFNLPNWTGSFTGFDIGEIQSTNDGWINNTGGATVFMVNVTIGAGSVNPMITSGTVELYNTVVQCPCTFGNGTTGTANGGCYFKGPLTYNGNSTLDIANSLITTGANIPIHFDTSGNVYLSNVTIDTSNTTAIDGTGAGTLTMGVIDYLDGNSIENLFTVENSATNNTNLHGWNGSVLEVADVTVTSDGAIITLSVEKNGGGNLTGVTHRGYYHWDTTPADTVALTVGTDTVPQLNYIYLLGSTKTLTASTTSFPAAGHIRIATVLCQSAASLQTDGAYKVHAWTDHIVRNQNIGHMADINSWIRHQNATWESGAAPTLTITPQGAAPDNVIFTSTAGTILQLHDHTFPAFAGTPDVYTVNDFTTPYNLVTDLNTLLTDSANVSMSGRYFSLVIWGVISESTGDCKLMVDLPSGSYNTQASLLADASKYTSFEIPPEFTGTGFLIAQLQLRHQVAAGGTWTSIATIDLRGQIPNISAGGSTASGTEFVDNTFRILDNADPTKEIAFQASGITTATTRTMTVQDADGTIAYTNVANYGTGATTFTDHGVLVGSGTAAITALAAATNGQLIIGSTGADPAVAALASADGSVTITNGAGTIDLAAAAGLTWSVEAGAAVGAAVNSGYISNLAGGVTYTIPTTAAVGSIIRICSIQGLSTIAQNAAESIVFGAFTTTVGVGGSLVATNVGDTIEIVCTVADTTWSVLSAVGNWTVN